MTRADLVGTWRVVIDSPGGELPFSLEIFDEASPGPGGAPAVIRNGAEAAPMDELSIAGRRVNLRIVHLDTALTGELDKSGDRLVGTWQLLGQSGPTTLPMRADKGQTYRFGNGGPKGDKQSVPTVAGTWKIEFGQQASVLGIGEFEQNGDTVTGTVIHEEGTFRYLEGRYADGFLQLSTFTGSIAVLIRGTAQPDGTFSGEIYYNDSGFFPFKAQRATEENPISSLPDPYSKVAITEPDRRLAFKFNDLDGNAIALHDPRFYHKVVLVELFGSWCPNCNDAAPILSQWYKRYHEQGLEIIGLAYEHTGDPERDMRQVRTYRDRYGIEYPLLLAGTSDLTKPLPGLSEVPAFPTMVFIDRNGVVGKIYNGFIGPSAPVHFENQNAALEAEIKRLLAQ